MALNKEDLVKELDAPIPRSAVRERKGNGDRTFSYLSGDYVIDRLNKVVGIGNWSYHVKELREVFAGEVLNSYGKKIFTAHYLAVVQVEVPVLGHAIFSDVGYGDGTDANSPGKTRELAAKEAVTDALKRAAKNLGMSMGLALYSKEQENVVDDKAEQAQTVITPPKRATVEHQDATPGSTPSAAVKPKTRKSATKPIEASPPTHVEAATAAVTPPKSDTKVGSITLNATDGLKRIASLSRIVIGKRILSLNQLKDKLNEDFGVTAKEDLTPEQMTTFVNELETLVSA